MLAVTSISDQAMIHSYSYQNYVYELKRNYCTFLMTNFHQSKQIQNEKKKQANKYSASSSNSGEFGKRRIPFKRSCTDHTWEMITSY